MEKIALYIPEVHELGFYQEVLQDPASMSYNAPWFPPDGCIDFPESKWAKWHGQWVHQEPERFFAYLKDCDEGKFVGYVSYRHVPEHDWWDISIVIKDSERGQGYGQVGLSLLLAEAFKHHEIHRLHNTFERSRMTAYHIHQKFGFEELDDTEDFCHLILTRDAYFATHKEGQWA